MKKMINNVKCFLLDMDGTIYLDNKVFDGAIDAVNKMRRQGRVIFLTNNSSTSHLDYVAKLNKLGFNVKNNEVYTSAMACCDLLKSKYNGKRVYLFSNEIVKNEYLSWGINVVHENPDVIVIAFNTEFNYDELEYLCDMIRNGIPFVCTHDDINCPTKNGFKPDVGSFLALIKSSTEKSPVYVCGKPYNIMGECIKKLVNLHPHEIAMVGDRLYTDIQFAINNDFVSVAVLSGESTIKDINAFKDKDKITYIKNGIWEIL